MENASKALLIAGGVLIAIVLITLLVRTYGNIGIFQRQRMTEEEIAKIEEYNREYTKYLGKYVYGTEVITAINRALNQNQYEFKVYIEFAEKYQYTIYEWVGGKKQEKIKTVNKNQTLEFANTEEGQILFSSIINGKEDETISDLKGRYFKCTKAEYDNNTGRIKAIRFVEQVRGTVVN